MSGSARFLLVASLLLLALCGCGRTVVTPRQSACVFDSDCSDGLHCIDAQCVPYEPPDGGPFFNKKKFGEPCDAGVECGSTFCLGGPAGAFCSVRCDAGAECPTAYDCKLAPDPRVRDGGLLGLCGVAQPLLCQDCSLDLDCGASGADRCLSLEGGSFCGRDCAFDGCPPLYACRSFAGGARQCVPEGRTCDCVPETLGLQKSCRGPDTGAGRCLGNQTCQADGGFTPCDAPQALAETCNGSDDDCDGTIDDLEPSECSRTTNGITCTGPNVCFASAGLVCTARTPAPEACNYEDDDCDGQTDEGFRLGRGLYTTNAHCGACNNDCATAIPHATNAACAFADDVPRCRATACEPGFYVGLDGLACLELPDTLCSPCQLDADCVGPGAKCLTLDGAKVCGRDCSATSVYPAGCPTGFTCAAGQCQPTSGTCSCTAQSQGSTRSCQVKSSSATCNGFSTCGTGNQWSACDVSTFNPEICDARDNNCDERIDEGFLNQATGRYEAATHCGFCNNDCTKYFSPTLQHTTGVCDVAPTMPRCAMGPCLTETVGGTTFEWVNVNAVESDGCECRRVQGNLTVDLPDRLPATGTVASYVDENCDGVDGVVADAIFVSAAATPGGNGTRTRPFLTITAGVAAQQSSGKRYVLVAQGLYRENVALFDGAQVFGGYAQDFLKRDPRLFTTTWEGVTPAGSLVAAVQAELLGAAGAAQQTVVSGFVLTGWDGSLAASPGSSGAASIAVLLRDVGPNFVLQNNDVLGGRGAPGGRGATGTQGFGRQASTTLNGQRGGNSQFFSNGTCSTANHRAGGAAGVNSTCGATATAGGSAVCPSYTFAGNLGAQQQYATPPSGSRNGPGGFDWSFDNLSGFDCGHVTESGFPTTIQQHDGTDGRAGADGVGGTGGRGAPVAARFGSFSGGRWVASPTGAELGGGGNTAEAGGGGGAGGGVARFVAGGCQGWEIGAAGGGGGAGGCGGTGGAAGGAGGGSFGVLIINSTAGALPTIRNNRIQRGSGGAGGDGGFGGAGGQGGAGGFGGTADRWSSSVGGKGGEGGNGGPGGGGGGGAGGPSFGVFAFNADLASLAAINTFLTGAMVDTSGAGGSGGSSPGGSSGTGGSGARGAFGNLGSLTSCAGGCAGTCDANGVCRP